VYSAYDDISGATNAVFDSGLSVENAVWLSTGYVARPGNNLYYATPSMGGVSGALSASMKEGGTDRSSAFHVKYEGGPVYAGAAYQVDRTAGGDTKFTRLNGSYDLGAAKILAGYGNVKSPAGAKTTDLSIGADVPLGAAVVLSAGYASSKTDGEARTSGFAVGAAYSLSKRTTVYGGLRTVNQEAVDLRDVAKTRVAVGLKHAF
jgi:predicted porin